MSKKTKFSTTIWCLLALFFSLPIFAEGFPDDFGQEIDPPPTAPIDSNLLLLAGLSLVFVAYFFYKKNRTVVTTTK